MHGRPFSIILRFSSKAGLRKPVCFIAATSITRSQNDICQIHGESLRHKGLPRKKGSFLKGQQSSDCCTQALFQPRNPTAELRIGSVRKESAQATVAAPIDAMRALQ